MTSIYEEIQIALHGIWSRRWLALAVAWAVALAGWLIVAFIPNTYESRARIFVEPRSILSDKVGSNPLEDQQALDQVRQTLTSADNLAKVVQGTDLAATVRTDADMGARVGMLKTNIAVISQQDNLFEITAKSSDRSISDRANAELSAQIVGKLIDIFSEENVSGNREETSTALKILDQQIADRARQLQQAEQARVGFEQRNMGMLPGTGSVSQRIDALRSELNQVDSQLVAAQSALAGINGQLGAVPATIDSGAPGGGGTSPLASAMGELAAARARGWTDSHPDVVSLRRQIESLRAMGGGAGGGMTRTPNPAYIQLRSLQAERAGTVAALQARRAEIQSVIGGLAARQTDQPGIAAEMDRLERDYAAIKAQYDRLVADREDARLRGEVQSEAGAFRFRLIDPPGVPSAPASPNRPLLLLGVLIAAIAAGVGVAFALSQIHTTYPTAVRLERATGLSVIGSITETLRPDAVEARRRKIRLFYGASAGLVAMCIGLVALEFVQRGMSA